MNTGLTRTRLALAALALSLSCVATSSEEPVRSLTLLHTNDLHARLLPDADGRGGFARLATAIRRECADSAGCLVLDGGDLVQGTPVSSLFEGVPIFELAGLLGLDATTLGNHEFDYGWRKIAAFRETADFPIVTANVVDDAGRVLGGTPWVVLEANRLRVGIIGVLTERLGDLTTADRYGPWRVLPVVEAVRRYLPVVRQRSDLVVVLGHLVDEEERALLTEIDGIAAVISGHGHEGLEHPLVVEDRPAVRVAAHGRELGRLDLRVHVETGRVVDWEWKAVPVDSRRFRPHPRLLRRIAYWEGKVSARVDVVIGESARALSLTETRALFERALRESVGADLAYLNPGGIRDTLPAGELAVRQVWNVMPFDNRVVVGTFEARELPAFLVRERKLDPDGTYTLATVDFVAARWRERRLIDRAFAEPGPLLRDVVIDWIREHRRLE